MLPHVASGKVRAPAGAAKERVPREERLAAAERDAARLVSRRLHDLKAQAADLHGVAVPVVFHILRHREAAGGAALHQLQLLFAHVEPGARGLQQGVRRADMVEVRVREQHRAAVELVVLQVVEDGARLVAGVYHGAVEAVLVRHDVAVRFKLPHGQGLYKHIQSSFVSRMMVTGPSFTEATCISAPNCPVSTSKPRARHSAMTSS